MHFDTSLVKKVASAFNFRIGLANFESQNGLDLYLLSLECYLMAVKLTH